MAFVEENFFAERTSLSQKRKRGLDRGPRRNFVKNLMTVFWKGYYHGLKSMCPLRARQAEPNVVMFKNKPATHEISFTSPTVPVPDAPPSAERPVQTTALRGVVVSYRYARPELAQPAQFTMIPQIRMRVMAVRQDTLMAA